jgi:ring-1,2-phenylacetyl-CoA epoxidase subunit PaaC
MEAAESAALSEMARGALRDLLLCLADSKRVLGLRYSDRMLGAPALEAGIAASSMAQDEWGHARLTYALLSDFGDDPKALETERSAAEYRSLAALDAPLDSWPAMIAAVLVADTALSVQYRALLDSRYQPVHNRVQKLLDEEAFHFQYAAGWTRQIAAAAEMRADLVAELRRMLPEALLWFGREEAEGARALLAEGVVSEGADALRARLLARVGPVLRSAGLAEEVGVAEGGGGWIFGEPLVWPEWSDSARRADGTQPDERVVERARGDRNRAMRVE